MFILYITGCLFFILSIVNFFFEGFWSAKAWLYLLLFFGICWLHGSITNRQKKISEKKEKEEQKEALKKEKERLKFFNSPEGKREIAYKELLDISQVSDKLARTILDQYPSLNQINAATLSELRDVPGVGQGLAKAIKIRVSKIPKEQEKIKKENTPKKISLLKKKKI